MEKPLLLKIREGCVSSGRGPDTGLLHFSNMVHFPSNTSVWEIPSRGFTMLTANSLSEKAL